MALPHITITRHFGRIKDPRRKHRRRHLLMDIIVMAICAVIAGADSWQEVVTFAHERREWLQTFLELPGGIPSHDTFERVFDRIDPVVFQACFRSWVEALRRLLPLDHVSIDGKSLRGSRRGELGALHLVSAWATAQHLHLGQIAVAEKSNEITAIPKLLELLDLNGALVTIDAMGCQKEIAAKIRERGGDYVLVVKDNQPTLRADIEACFKQAFESDFAEMRHSQHTTEDRGHGRVEMRQYFTIVDPRGLSQADDWDGLRVIGMCYRERTIGDKTSTEANYFIGSRVAGAKAYGRALRGHWGIENHQHRQLDVSFREDSNRVSKRHAAENLAVVRRLALCLLKQHPDKRSIANKRYAAALNPRFLAEVLRGDVNSEKT